MKKWSIFFSLFLFSISFLVGQVQKPTLIKLSEIFNSTKFVYADTLDCNAPGMPCFRKYGEPSELKKGESLRLLILSDESGNVKQECFLKYRGNALLGRSYITRTINYEGYSCSQQEMRMPYGGAQDGDYYPWRIITSWDSEDITISAELVKKFLFAENDYELSANEKIVIGEVLRVAMETNNPQKYLNKVFGKRIGVFVSVWKVAVYNENSVLFEYEKEK